MFRRSPGRPGRASSARARRCTCAAASACRRRSWSASRRIGRPAARGRGGAVPLALLAERALRISVRPRAVSRRHRRLQRRAAAHRGLSLRRCVRCGDRGGRPPLVPRRQRRAGRAPLARGTGGSGVGVRRRLDQRPSATPSAWWRRCRPARCCCITGTTSCAASTAAARALPAMRFANLVDRLQAAAPRLPVGALPLLGSLRI